MWECVLLNHDDLDGAIDSDVDGFTMRTPPAARIPTVSGLAPHRNCGRAAISGDLIEVLECFVVDHLDVDDVVVDDGNEDPPTTTRRSWTESTVVVTTLESVGAMIWSTTAVWSSCCCSSEGDVVTTIISCWW